MLLKLSEGRSKANDGHHKCGACVKNEWSCTATSTIHLRGMILCYALT